MWFLLVLLIGGAGGARILALFPFPFYSHTHTFLPVFRELAARGHHITFLSPFPQQYKPHNWTDLVIQNDESMKKYLANIAKGMSNVNGYSYFKQFWIMCFDLMELAYEDETLGKLIRSETLDFDLIIMEPLFCQESLVALGHKHNIPIVAVYPFELTPWGSMITGNDFLPSYIPELRTPYSDRMSFLERFDNTLLTIFELFIGLYGYLPKQEMLMKSYFYSNDANHPRLLELLQNISLHLIDSHHSIGYARHHQPHSIPVGGLTTMNNDPLPPDLEDYLSNSPNGVIYISFGNNLPLTSMTNKFLESLLTAFKNLDVNVLMKWENDTLPNKPTNVNIRKWFPQTSVLAHPKCRVFITHGGLHSISEAAYHGVPIVGIPFFSDQLFNIKFAEKSGFGYTVLQEEITANNIRQALETVLIDKSYKMNAVKRSMITRDRPESAMNTTLFWIEYTIRHKDLSHLRPASASLPFYQLFLLDVFLVILIAFFTFIVLVFFIIKCVFKSITKPKGKTKNY